MTSDPQRARFVVGEIVGGDKGAVAVYPESLPAPSYRVGEVAGNEDGEGQEIADRLQPERPAPSPDWPDHPVYLALEQQAAEEGQHNRPNPPKRAGGQHQGEEREGQRMGHRGAEEAGGIEETQRARPAQLLPQHLAGAPLAADM